MSEVETLYKNGLAAYSADNKGTYDGTLLAGYIKRLLSRTEPALVTEAMQSLILRVFDQSRFQNSADFAGVLPFNIIN